MRKQSYSNHRHFIFLFHGLLLALCILALICSFINLVISIDDHENVFSAFLLFLTTVILGFLYYFIRRFAVRLQDRIIRMEENFRHYQLTGKSLDQRLSMRQIVALRFAPESEFIELVKDASEKRMSEEEIKKSIKRWKGDYHRV